MVNGTSLSPVFVKVSTSCQPSQKTLDKNILVEHQNATEGSLSYQVSKIAMVYEWHSPKVFKILNCQNTWASYSQLLNTE